MGDVAVVEASQHVDDGIGVSNVGEELVAEPFAFRRPLDESGDIDDLDGGGDHFFRVIYPGKFHQAFVRNGDDTHIGFYRAEREVRRLCLRIGEAVEKGRFTDVGQSDYPAL